MAEQAQRAAGPARARRRPLNAEDEQVQRPGPVNEVRLVGRMSAEPEVREMPSGDQLVTWRLIVDRGPVRRPAPAGTRVPSVDTVDCVAWSAGVRRTVRGLRPGDVVEVRGALRKRFWRAGGPLSSRTEVEVELVRRLARA